MSTILPGNQESASLALDGGYYGLLARRYGMMGIQPPPKASDYIQNGLEFQLDGIEKGNISGAWVDLIGGKVFSNYGATLTKNGFRFDGVDDYMETIDDCSSICNSKHTIEVVINRYTDTKDSPIIVTTGTGSYGRAIIIQTGDIIIQAATKTTLYSHASSDIPVGVPSTYSRCGNLTNAFVNYVKKARTGFWGKYNNVKGNFIGKIEANLSAYFQGEIMAIRMYNRNLSDNEVLFNQQLDNIRFNLGL